MTDPIVLRVDNDLADQIVAAWLKQHIEWANYTLEHARHPDDANDAKKDIEAFSRILDYVGAKDD